MNQGADLPNIVLIHTDQQRGDCLSIDGHPVLRTPNLDHLAASGARFRRAYSECPICIPARHTILTGIEPHQTGVTGYAVRARIADPRSTLPELLRQAGYQTAHVGRNWHQYPAHRHYGFEIMDSSPFAEYYSRFHQLGVHPFGVTGWPRQAGHGIGVNSICARPWPYADEFHETNFAVNKAVEFLAKRDLDRPFLLSVGITAPHPPLVPPVCYMDRYLGIELDGPAIGDWAVPPPDGGLGRSPSNGRQVLQGEMLRQTKAGYYGMIAHVDDQLAHFFEYLSEVKSPTYVIFISDHGEMLGDHYFWRKSLPYEGAARVPFLVSGPDIRDGFVSDAPVGLQDVMPTCCELAGVEVPAHVTGRSVLPILRGEVTATREWIHGEHGRMPGHHPGMHYLTDGKAKYIWFNDGTEQFFDLTEDPRELRNLAKSDGRREEVGLWRGRLIRRLEGRPEGFSDGEKLIPHRPYSYYNSLAVVDEQPASF